MSSSYACPLNPYHPLISLPSLSVARERIERACILTRLAPSFLRIGSFEALSPPPFTFFLGGGQQKADLDALRVLGEWVVRRVLRLDIPDGAAWGQKLVMEVVRRNARMVAGWQAYGSVIAQLFQIRVTADVHQIYARRNQY